ncbi:DUF7948 domain-containing protein [Nitrospira sp. Kam-Ns4a]
MTQGTLAPETQVIPRSLALALAVLGAGAAFSNGTGPPSSLSVSGHVQPGGSDPAGQAKIKIKEAYGALPLAFEANQGQTDRRVQFFARGRGFRLFLTAPEAVLAIRQPGTSPHPPLVPPRSPDPPPAAGALLRMQFVGISPAVRIVGTDRLPGRVNYFVGQDPTRWHTAIPTFAKVRYQDLYRGIDLVYDGTQGHLEYDFIVAPGADPSDIRLKFTGIEAMSLDEAGNLRLQIGEATVHSLRPQVYQERKGVRREVASRYRLLGEHQVGFSLGAYDRSLPLVIDPILVYSTFLGGAEAEQAFGIAVDSAGDAYVTGATESADFPATTPLTALQAREAFVTKLNASGTSVIYSTVFGGDSFDEGHGIAVDAVGNAYVLVQTASHDYPITPGAFQRCHSGPSCDVSPGAFDLAVTKLNPDGNALVYSTFLGPSDDIFSRPSLAIDGEGNAYVTGGTTSPDFPTANALQPAFGGGRCDGIILKLNPTGTGLVYSTFLGGEGDDAGRSIAVDAAGNAYVTGHTNSLAFPIVQPFQATFGGGQFDAFVAKVAASGAALVYSTYLGGNLLDTGDGIKADADGHAYLTGTTQSDDFPIVGQIPGTRGTGADAFVAKLTPAGNSLIYSTYIGGNNHDFAHGLALAATGGVSITGSTFSDNFPTVEPVQSANHGDQDVFVATVNPAGTALTLSTYLGGAGTDIGHSLAVDQAGSLSVAGTTNSSDFPVTAGAFQAALRGNSDGFVAKIRTLPTSTTTTTTTTTTSTTTTTTAPPAVHDVICQFAPSQPAFKIMTVVQVRVVVTNVGTVAEPVRVTLSGTINYSAAQTVTVPAGSSVTLLFDYPVPVRTEVTLTATAELAPGLADATPANNSDTKTYPTTVL